MGQEQEQGKRGLLRLELEWPRAWDLAASAVAATVEAAAIAVAAEVEAVSACAEEVALEVAASALALAAWLEVLSQPAAGLWAAAPVPVAVEA